VRCTGLRSNLSAMAFLLGYAKAGVGAVNTVAGGVATGVAAGLGAVSGDYRAADACAEYTRWHASGTVNGLSEAGRGFADVGRATTALVDTVNPGGNYNPLYSVPRLNGWDSLAATVADYSYKAYSDRPSSFKDDEGCEWKEMSPSDWGYSHKYITAYANGKENVMLGFRGTADLVDVFASDAAILLGALPPERCGEAESVARNFVRKGKNVRVCGHSLGGNIAMFIALALDLNGYAFNPGAAPQDFLAKRLVAALRSKCRPGSVRVHRINTCLISMCTYSSEAIAIFTYNKKKGYTPGGSHSLDQFLP